MKIITDKKIIEEILERGIETVTEKESLLKKMFSGKKLRIKFGVDPTGPILHLGHSVALRLLRRFQDLGHTVILLVGDFTAKIGDPTGRTGSRPPLNDGEIKRNMATYTIQASKILNIKRVEVHYNSEWFDKMPLSELFKLFGKVTYGQVVRRRDFKKRLQEDNDFTFAEFMYPIYQGYDSVALRADIEVGGTDQQFNMLMGRRIQRRYDMQEQNIITVPILEGLDGVKKMSKSEGNFIAIRESANEMYGKIMTIPDALIIRYFKLCTDVSNTQINKIKNMLKRGENPNNSKKSLAREIVTIYHGQNAALKAENEFNKTFRESGVPKKITEINLKKNTTLADELLKTGIVSSKSEWRRLINEGAVKTDFGEKITNPDFIPQKTTILKIGKRRFVKIVI